MQKPIDLSLRSGLLLYACGYDCLDQKRHSPKAILHPKHPKQQLIVIVQEEELHSFMCDACWDAMQRRFEEERLADSREAQAEFEAREREMIQHDELSEHLHGDDK